MTTSDAINRPTSLCRWKFKMLIFSRFVYCFFIGYFRYFDIGKRGRFPFIGRLSYFYFYRMCCSLSLSFSLFLSFFNYYLSFISLLSHTSFHQSLPFLSFSFNQFLFLHLNFFSAHILSFYFKFFLLHFIFLPLYFRL